MSMQKVNYQLVCDKQIEELCKEKSFPKLLLQSCCGPCSTYVLEYLTRFFEVTILYYNPNIYPEEEHEKRLEAQLKVISKLEAEHKIQLLECSYDHDEFLNAIKGLEAEAEGGIRCAECFRLRLFETARLAKKYGFDCFTTTLTVSPHKNAEVINKIGREIAESENVFFLEADFKKREGYKRSIVLSEEFGLYRQKYCGCEFSINTETEKE